MPDEALLRAMGAYNEELLKAGVLLAGEGLAPSSQGARVTFDGTSRTVTRGPFGATRELVAGFWIFQVASLEECIAWVERCPNPMPETCDIEIRRIFEMSDFADVTGAAAPPR